MIVTLSMAAKWTSLTKDCVEIVAVVVTVYAAVRGLNAWRRQLVGTAALEVMRAVLRSAIRLREAVLSARKDFASSQSVKLSSRNITVAQCVPKRVQQDQWRGQSQAIDSIVAELGVAAIEAEALWGEQAREPIQQLENTCRNYTDCVQRYLYSLEEDGTETDESIAVKPKVDPPDEDHVDELKDNLNVAVSKIQDYVRSKIGFGRLEVACKK